MGPAEVLETLRDRGYTATVRDGRLKLKGPARPPADLERLITDCRDELVRILEGLEHPLECPCIDCSAPEPKYAKPIETVGEVLDMARAILNPEGTVYDPPPAPPAAPGRDPLVRHTDKAEFLQEVRERDAERRRSAGPPAWIRPTNRGDAA